MKKLLCGVLLVVGVTMSVEAGRAYQSLSAYYWYARFQPSQLSDELLAKTIAATEVPMASPYAAVVLGATIPLTIDEATEQKQFLDSIASWQPHSALVYRQALLNLMLGDYALAEAQLAKATFVYPGDKAYFIAITKEPNWNSAQQAWLQSTAIQSLLREP